MKASLSVVALLGVTMLCIPMAFAGEGTSKQGNKSEIGTPVPGSAADQESTQKKRQPSKDQSADRNAQITLGGAKSPVIGEVLKVEGDHYFLKDAESGDEVRLMVNQDTHLICEPSSSEKATIGKRSEDAAGGTEHQARQGQKPDETATGSGFQVGGKGQCAFKAGDKVKAEVSDLGTVTTLRYISDKGK